jgi:XRE family transcriptional regulator, regulator of sulfur utilization
MARNSEQPIWPGSTMLRLSGSEIQDAGKIREPSCRGLPSKTENLCHLLDGQQFVSAVQRSAIARTIFAVVCRILWNLEYLVHRVTSPSHVSFLYRGILDHDPTSIIASVAKENSGSINTRFGERVRRLREKREWTLTYFSVHSGLAKTFIHDLETGRKEPCLGTIEVIAKSFEITISQLMKGL